MSHILVIASQRYNRNEFWPVLKVLLAKGHTFEVVSTDHVIRDEKTFQPNKVKRTIYEVPNVSGFDGVLVVSGNPEDTEIYWHDKKSIALIAEANERNLPIGAICSAVPAIRFAAEGRKVSVYPLLRSLELLRIAGVEVSKASIWTDGNLATAENEAMALMWIENFCALLAGEEVPYVFGASPFKRKLRELRPIPELEHIKHVVERTGRRRLNDEE